MIAIIRKPLPRRKFLRGAGGAFVALPLLQAMMPRRASAAVAPKRFVFFFFANGVNPASWAPAGTAPQLGTLSPTLRPLEPLRDRMVLLSGLDMATARANPGNGHNVGVTNLLTGRKFLLEKQTEFGAVGWGAGPTIDQEIAGKLRAPTRFASLQFGVQTFKSYGANAYSYISYAGPQKPIPCEDDPRKMFARLFSNVGASQPEQQLRLSKRKSVLDFVAEDMRQLSSKLGSADKAKLDAHYNAVREIEARLTVQGQAAGSCQPPTLEPLRDHNANAAYPQVGRMQMDLLAMALACDLTRVATLQWSSAQSGTTHTWADVTASHHGYSHLTDATAMAGLARIQNWYITQLAYLGSALAALKEETTSVLDSTILLASSEVAVGASHAFRDMPMVMLGGGAAGIKGNRWLKYGGASHNDLFVAVQNAMGLGATTFGDPMYCKGALPGLVG